MFVLVALAEQRHSDANDSLEDDESKTTKKPDMAPGMKLCAAAACIALLVNIILAITAFSIGYSRPKQDGIATVSLYEGSCTTTKQSSIGLHLLINVLGTIILSTSNYCAQFVAAPTRYDVDRAHCQRSWMDIGVPSHRNIGKLTKRHKLMWATLVVTTFPIHALLVAVS